MYRARAIREFAKGDATKADVAYSVSGGDGVALLAADSAATCQSPEMAASV